MFRCRWLVAALVVGCCVSPALAQKKPAKPTSGALQWIWSDGATADNAPAGTRYFRKTFTVGRSAEEAALDIAADPGYTVWVNGKPVGTGSDWKAIARFDVREQIVDGKNVVAVEVKHPDAGPAGLLVRLGYIPNGQSKMALTTDATWKVSDKPADGWTKPEFDDRKWANATALGAYNHAGRWTGQTWQAGGDDRFTAPPGFRVEMIAKNPNPADPFSLVNMTFDGKGRLLVAQERGPILLCKEPDSEGVLQSVTPYCTAVKNCHGICSVGDYLYMMGDGPGGTGLFRGKEGKAGTVDVVELVHKFKGPMAEHGPHAILHGPDGMLYLVTGNHAWAQPKELAKNSPLVRWPTGYFGPDQGQPNTNEDVLLPRLNDARGHAANILAPGGTIWRCDLDGNNMSLVAAGFRNHFDAAFTPDGELWTFDSDMEWDVGLPWYRAVRVVHTPIGGDFVWRTGAANTPAYYLDSLPPAAETGRGSPVGVECYDADQFPAKYRGALLMADWSIGCIYAVTPERHGAGFTGKTERFVTGAPMNITDLAVAPDGSVYFTMGGRGTQGGVCRISYTGPKSGPQATRPIQPLAAWSKERASLPMPMGEGALNAAMKGRDAALRAKALLTIREATPFTTEVLTKALADADPLVQRRACEALIRVGHEPDVAALVPLLATDDRFLRTAARLVLQRIDPAKWATALLDDKRDIVAEEAIVALCKTHQASAFAAAIYERLNRVQHSRDAEAMLNALRCFQLALIHTGQRPPQVQAVAKLCYGVFPVGDDRLNRELAILLASLSKDGTLPSDVHAKLLDALLASTDQQQQIHYAYCLRLLHDGWTPEQKTQFLRWYESTKTWKGGASFAPFLENILRDLSPIFTADDLGRLLSKASDMPWASKAVLKFATGGAAADPIKLSKLLDELKGSTLPANERTELRAALVEALGKTPTPAVQKLLRRCADEDAALNECVAHALCKQPTADNFPYFVRGLESSSNPVVLFEIVNALKKCPIKPKADEPAPFRAVLTASPKIGSRNAAKVVDLLRHWTGGKQFGAEPDQMSVELNAWTLWYGQTFPKEPALAVATPGGGSGKYAFDDLKAYLESDPAGMKGDSARGRAVFEKAQCLKCHKYGSEGAGIGPELTTLKQRFKRADTLEAILYPSKVIADQYRSTTITTVQGQQITGIAAPDGDTVAVVLQDATKVVLKKSDIDAQFASLVSVMPEKLLDTLSKQEIADLFAYLESEPK